MEIESPLSLFLFFGFLLLFLTKLLFLSTPKSPKRLPPQPWKLPLLGHIHHLAGTLPHLAVAKLAKKLGPIIHLQLGESSTIVISSARLAKEVMKTQDLSFASRPTARLSLQIVFYHGAGIVFAPYGDYWRQMRKICVMELLSAKKVRSFYTMRDEESWNMVESIRSMAQGEHSVNLSEKIFEMMKVTICRVVVGDRFKGQDELMALIKEVLVLPVGFDVCNLFPSIKLLPIVTGMKTKLRRIHSKIDRILEDIIAEHHQVNEAKSMTGNVVSRENDDILDVLLRLKDEGGLEFPITSDNVKAVLLDMFAAGADTSAVTLEWAMSELMRNPRVMKKAQEEIRSMFTGKKKISESHVQELKYLKLVVKETLRLHPPLPLLLPRICRESCEIDEYHIPINTKILVNVWLLGRDPDNWEDAESFVPERFNYESINFVGTDFEFLPFGAGRRICPGLSLGMANVELTLARLLYHFNWKLPDGATSEDLEMNENFGVVLSRKNKLHLVPIWYNIVDGAY